MPMQTKPAWFIKKQLIIDHWMTSCRWRSASCKKSNLRLIRQAAGAFIYTVYCVWRCGSVPFVRAHLVHARTTFASEWCRRRRWPHDLTPIPIPGSVKDKPHAITRNDTRRSHLTRGLALSSRSWRRLMTIAGRSGDLVSAVWRIMAEHRNILLAPSSGHHRILFTPSGVCWKPISEILFTTRPNILSVIWFRVRSNHSYITLIFDNKD